MVVVSLPAKKSDLPSIFLILIAGWIYTFLFVYFILDDLTYHVFFTVLDDNTTIALAASHAFKIIG